MSQRKSLEEPEFPPQLARRTQQGLVNRLNSLNRVEGISFSNQSFLMYMKLEKYSKSAVQS